MLIVSIIGGGDAVMHEVGSRSHWRFEPSFYGIMRSVFSIMAKCSVCSTEEVIPYHIPNSVVGFGFGVSIGVGLGTSLNSH
jgi:hypothetical protein